MVYLFIKVNKRRVNLEARYFSNIEDIYGN